METIFFSIRRDDLQLDGGLMSSFSAPWLGGGGAEPCIQKRCAEGLKATASLVGLHCAQFILHQCSKRSPL